MQIAGFNHSAGEVGLWCEQELGVRCEASTAGEKVTIHPRPRELTPAEAAQIQAFLGSTKPFSISVDSARIEADDIDTATITITTDPAISTIQLDVQGEAEDVSLVSGVGTLELTADTPTIAPHVTVGAVDTDTYGFKTVTVRAV
tara:strand:- start:1238 stop:1672 length:435 start_codon:yes stop_codon:yes gene_type:complete